MKKIGMLTIGQSPRNDLIPMLKEIIGNVEIIEAGALDGVSYEEVKEIDLKLDDYILVTRMRDGREVKITKKWVLPRMQEKLDEIESHGVRLTVVMCTGKFPQFKSKGIVVTPMEIMKGVLEATIKSGKIGVVYPTHEQIEGGYATWERPGVEIYGDSVSPYEADDVDALCERLAKENLDIILLNCFGFPLSIKNTVIEKTGVPALHSSALVARVVKELIQ